MYYYQVQTQLFVCSTLPPQAHETKVVTPCAHIEMNTLAVLACLYCDHVADLATK